MGDNPTGRRSSGYSVSSSPSEGIDLKPHYKYVVCEWPYIQLCLANDFDTSNARNIRGRSFNL